MTTSLQLLAVQAQLDASQYVEEAQRVVEANKQMGASGKDAAASQKDLGTAHTDAAQRLGVSTTAIDRLERTINPAKRAQDELAKGTALLNAALANSNKTFGDSKFTLQRYNEDMALLQRRYGDASQSSDEHGRSADKLNVSYRSLETGVKQFMENLASGAGPFAAASMAMESLSRAFHGLELITTGAIGIGLAAIGAGLYVVLSRAEESENQLRFFNNQLDVMGTRGSASADQMQKLVLSLRDTGSTTEQAMGLVAAIGQIPQLMADPRWDRIPAVARDLAAAFRSTDAVAFEHELTAAFQGGGAAMEQLAIKYNVLHGHTAALMLEMTRSGDSTKEFFVLLDALMAKYGDSFENTKTQWDRTKDEIRAGWNELIQEMSKSGALESAKANLIGVFKAIPPAILAAQELWTDFTATVKEIAAPGINADDWKEAGSRAGSALIGGVTAFIGSGDQIKFDLATAELLINWAKDTGNSAGGRFVEGFVEAVTGQLPDWLKNALLYQIPIPIAISGETGPEARAPFAIGQTILPQWPTASAQAGGAAIDPQLLELPADMKLNTDATKENSGIIQRLRDSIDSLWHKIDFQPALQHLDETLAKTPAELGAQFEAGLLPLTELIRVWQSQQQQGGGGGATPYPGAEKYSAINIGGATPGEQAVLGMVYSREGGAGGYQAQNKESSASGYPQFIDATWKLVAAMTGLGQEFAHAKDAPPAVQDANALAALRKWGPNSGMTWKASGVDKGQPYPTAEELDGQIAGINAQSAAFDNNTAARDKNQTAQNTQAQESPGYKRIMDEITHSQVEQQKVFESFGPAQAYRQAYYEKEHQLAGVTLTDTERQTALDAAGNVGMQRNIEMRNRQTAINEALAASHERVAKAYGISTAAGQQQETQDKALLETFQRNQNMTSDNIRSLGQRSQAVQDATSLTERQVQVENLAVGSEISAAQKRIAAATDTSHSLTDVALAYAQSTRAGKEAQAEATAQLLTGNVLINAEKTLADARANGNQQLTDQATRNLDAANALKKHAEEVELNTAAQRENLQVGQLIGQLRNQMSLAQGQIAAVGLPSDEFQKNTEQLRLQLSIKESLASPELKQMWEDVGQAVINVNYQLREMQRDQSRIDELMRGVADTINSTIGSALNDLFADKKITDWGARIQTMLRSISTQIIQSQFTQPLLGSLFGGSVGQQYGTLGSGSSLLGLGKLLGGGGSSSGGLLGMLGLGGGYVASTGTSGVNALSLGELADLGVPTTASAVGGIGGILGSISSFLGPIAMIGGLLGGLFKVGGPAPTNAAGGVIDLATGQAGGVSGSGVNAKSANEMISGLSTAIRDLEKSTGGTLPGQIAAQTFTNKQGQAVYQLDYAGQLGKVSAQFSSAADAVSAATIWAAQNLQGLSSTLTTVMQHITDPSQIQAAIAFANAYDRVATAFDSLFSSIEGAAKQAGPYSQTLDKISAQYQTLLQGAQQYGLPTDTIFSSFSAAVTRLRDDFNQNIQDMTDAANNALAGTLKAEEDAGKQRVADAMAVGADLAAVDQYNAANLEKLAIAGASSLSQMAGGFDDTVGQLAASFKSAFASIETQITQTFQGQAGISQLSGQDQFSQAFNTIRAQAEAARQAAAQSYPTTPEGYQPQIDAANKTVADLTQKYNDFAKATLVGNVALNDAIDSTEKYAALIASTAEQAAQLGQAVQTALSGVETAAVARVAADFTANIKTLYTGLTDPVQAAVSVEYAAGQSRLEVAKATGADLALVEAYNQANLEKKVAAATQAANNIVTLQDVIDAAVGKLGTLATTGDLGKLGTFGQAISSVVQNMTGPFTQALIALNAALGASVQQVTDRTAAGATPDFSALVQGYASAIDQMRTTYNSQIDALTLAITDPVQNALNVELAAGKQRVADAQAIGADLAKVDEFNRLNLVKVFDQVEASANAAAAAVTDFSSSLDAITGALQQVGGGALSGLTPGQQAQAGLGQFRTTLGEVQGGDTSQLSNLAQAGTQAVTLAQAAYGNSARTIAIRDEVTKNLQSVATSTAQQAQIAAAKVATDQTALAQNKATLTNEASAAHRVADQLQLQADAELKRTGIVNASLQNQANAAGAVAYYLDSIVGAQSDVSSATADQAKLADAQTQQTAAIGSRQLGAQSGAADAAVTAWQMAMAQLSTQQNIAQQQQASQQSQLDAEITIAQQVLSAQKAAADAFTAAVSAYTATVATAKAAVPVTPPMATDEGWQAITFSGSSGWHSFYLTPEQVAQWQGWGFDVTTRGTAGGLPVSGHPGYYNYDVNLTGPLNATVMGTAAQARYYAATGLSVQGFAAGTPWTPPGWIMVGEKGPELMFQHGGNSILPTGTMPPANDDLRKELVGLREALATELAALRSVTQAVGQRAARDAGAVINETAALNRKVGVGGQMRRVV